MSNIKLIEDDGTIRDQLLHLRHLTQWVATTSDPLLAFQYHRKITVILDNLLSAIETKGVGNEKVAFDDDRDNP